ncbi:hypothetical protein Bbelb_257920 [Branchiostoma belcheri]|nr:hypothetical protein Bbelb_257920 [Branchiostoma belcheri]
MGFSSVAGAKLPLISAENVNTSSAESSAAYGLACHPLTPSLAAANAGAGPTIIGGQRRKPSPVSESSSRELGGSSWTFSDGHIRQNRRQKRATHAHRTPYIPLSASVFSHLATRLLCSPTKPVHIGGNLKDSHQTKHSCWPE